MKKIFINLSVLVAFLFYGCGSSSSYIKPGINLSGFRNVYIAPLKYEDGSIDKFGVGNLLMKKFSQKGFTILNESQVMSIDLSELGQLLYCEVSHYGVTATVNLYNYKRELVYNGEGSFVWGLTNKDDICGAVEKAFSNFESLYLGFDPKSAINVAEEIKKQFKDWEKIEMTESELKTNLISRSNDLSPIEGIWSSIEDNQYFIGIIRDTNSDRRDYVAFIIQTENSFWEPKQVKIEFKSTSYQSVYTTTYYMADHSKQGTTAFINDKGLLEIKLKNNDQTELTSKFIKNFPTTDKVKEPSEGKSQNEKWGSGFIISQQGLIATNWHVVADSKIIEVYFPTIGKTFIGTILLKDKNNDIAILKLQDFVFDKIFSKPIPFSITASNKSKQGHKVFTLGFPLGSILGESAKLSDGIINSLFGIQDDPRLMLISNPLQPGNSGGPLFNSAGEVIGLVVSSLNAKYFYENDDILPQNVNFAVKSDYLLNLCSMLDENKEITQRQNDLKNLPIDKQVDLIKPFMVNIKVK